MVWLIVLISINGGPPRVLDKIPYEDLQSCQAEKVARDSRRDYFVESNGDSVERKVMCLTDPAALAG
jgi:hypothetical protein